MTLPHDICRCSGGNGTDEICPDRDKCLRYIHRTDGGYMTPYSNFYQGPSLFECEQKMEAPNAGIEPHT